MSEQEHTEVSTNGRRSRQVKKLNGTTRQVQQRPADDDKEAWKAYWEAQGKLWRTEPEIDKERQKYLDERRSIKPDIERGIYPFKEIDQKMSRADVEWLLATHEQGYGPVDDNAPIQKYRVGLDLRGADLREVDLSYLPLVRLQGGLEVDNIWSTPDEKLDTAAILLSGARLYAAHLESAILNGAHLEDAYLVDAHLNRAKLFGAHLKGANLIDAELVGADLSKAQLDNADIMGAHFERAHLWESNFKGSDLSGANFDGAKLGDTNFKGARLVTASFKHAHLVKANLEKANLGGADLEGARLEYALLKDADLSEANLKKANLSTANVEGANMFMACLADANLWQAKLRGVILYDANLKGANLHEVVLAGADLSRASLKGANLSDAVLGDEHRIGPSLVDIKWGNCNLALTDWSQISKLGEEHKADQQLFETSGHSDLDGREKSKEIRLDEYKDAVRVYNQLSIALRAHGLNEDAARFTYRAHLMQRKVYWYQGKFGQYFFSLFLDLLAGYGYRPGRSLVAYALVIAIFATIYYLFGPHLAWNEAIVISMTAFHGRGFFPEQFKPGDPQAMVAAIEAFVGLLIEVTFIATLTQRLFGK